VKLGFLLVAVVAACGTNGGGGTEVAVDTTTPGRAVPDDFVGLSIEWDNVPAYLGDGAGGARAATVRLLREMVEEGQRPLLRIGGNSQDQHWWNPAGLPRPPGVLNDIGPGHISTLAALQAQLGAQLVIGLNFALADADNAAALIAAVRAAIPPTGIQAYELGNEPDSYVAQGHRVEPWEWATYFPQVLAFRDAVAARVGTPIPFQCPSLAGRRWLGDLESGIDGMKDEVDIVSTHVYPYTACLGLPPPAPLDLLDDRSTVMVGATYAPHAAAAHEAGLGFRMGELNSVSCGGAPNVSDTYSAGLWAADLSMQLAVAGVDGVNFHGGAPPGSPSHYAAFVFDATGKPRVQPVFYGLRLVALVTAAHGRLVPVEVPAAAPIRAFATLGADGATRVLLLRVAAEGEDRVLLRAAGATASLVRLHAPDLTSTTGLTLGGQTWDGTVDGAPVGAAATETPSREGDAWVVDLPAYDAAVITVR